MSKVMTRTFQGSMVLGQTAKETIESFILNQLGPEAETDLEVTPVTADNIKQCQLFWRDNGDVILVVEFGAEGTWTSS